MPLIQLNNATKTVGGKTLFSNLDVNINQGEQLAIIGPNGSGKTTLMNVLQGDTSLDSGTRSVVRDISVVYSAQLPEITPDLTVDTFSAIQHPIIGPIKQALLSAEQKMDVGEEIDYDAYAIMLSDFELTGGYTLITKVLEQTEQFGLRVNPDTDINALSVGEQKLLQISVALASTPDILLLDEPTNHVEPVIAETIDQVVIDFKGAVVYSTHDRFLLNKVGGRILELGPTPVEFNGTYDDLIEFKQHRFNAEMRRYQAENKKKMQLRTSMLKMKSIGSSGHDKAARVAKNLERRIDKMTRKKPRKDSKPLNISFLKSQRGGDIVLRTKMRVGYEGTSLLGTVDVELNTGDRVGLIGRNGTGKSAFVKQILGYEPPLEGEVYIGPSIDIGYLPQKIIFQDSNEQVLDYLLRVGCEDRTSAHGVLNAWQFDDSDLEKEVSVLSGGEKKKLMLIKIMLKQPNFLILDDPTQHLDMISREGLGRAISEYQGTLLVISQDRYFLDEVTISTWMATNNQLLSFEGSYSENLHKIATYNKDY